MPSCTEDSPLLFLWYKTLFGQPFYSVDFRNGPGDAPSHWKDNKEKGALTSIGCHLCHFRVAIIFAKIGIKALPNTSNDFKGIVLRKFKGSTEAIQTLIIVPNV